jgi:phenylacetate-coenzyme A ligase PaaK-like adenylate-forming protein
MLLRDARRSQAALAPGIHARLSKLLVAATAVPHYREQMRQAGYDPARNFNGPEDLSILAITRKSDIKASPLNFVQAGESARLEHFFSDRTSGSTGMPLTVYRSPRERETQIAKWLRVLIVNGYRPTDKVLSFTSPGRLAEGRSALQRFGLLQRKAIDYTLPTETLADEVLQYRPDVVYGVRTSLLMVAEELERRGIQIPPSKLLVAGGEVIDAQTRQQCRRVFGTDITETYGTVEMGVMAYQQRGLNGLSLIEDCTLFEFLDEQGNPAKPGQLARIVVTDLHGWLMPFIRYDQGDLATYSLKQNAHGETVRVIDRIVGRQDDIALLPDGRYLTYLDFYEVMDIYPGVQRFRIRQHAADSFLIELVAGQDYYRSIQGELLTKLQALSPLPLRFEIRLVERIDPDPSGKMRMLVSEVMR